MDKDDKNINDTENEEIIDTPAAEEDAEFEKALAAVENSKTVKIKNKEETFFAKFAAKCAQDKIFHGGIGQTQPPDRCFGTFHGKCSLACKRTRLS